MAWKRNTDKGRWNPNNNQGPWGQQPQGGGDGGETPPDLDDLLKRSQDRLRRLVPPGLGGAASLVLIAAALAVVWLASGIYMVSTKERGVVLQFGKYSRTTEPGLQYHLPWPIETVYLPESTRIYQEAIGGTGEGDTGEENLMLTKDRNFLSINFMVQYRITGGAEKSYLFNVSDPRQTVIDVAKAAMREVVGRSNFDELQTTERTAAEEQTRGIIQQTLNSYGAGIEVSQVNIQRVDPPEAALDAARAVETARQEKETARNNAEAYQNRIIPEARGQAAKAIQDAEAYKQRVIAEAQGEAQRFDLIYAQYKLAPEVTRRRIYIETLEDVLSGMNKVIVDGKSGGVVPYLPLPALKQSQPAAPPASGAN